ncbi:MAG: 7-cyano-7-deazaguanine synthase QueC [bacterium]
MAKERAIAILSGGLDSSVSLLKALKVYEVILALTFDYGQRAAAREMKAAEDFCVREKIPFEVLHLPWLAKLTNTSLVNRGKEIPKIPLLDLDNPAVASASAHAVWVPNRNGLFLNVAACFADRYGAKVLITGFNEEEAATFPDNSAAFTEAVSKSLFYSTEVKTRVESFTQNMTKDQIVKEALELKLPLENLWSCYEGGERPCGTCESCLRTRRAFQNNGVWETMKGRFLHHG